MTTTCARGCEDGWLTVYRFGVRRVTRCPCWWAKHPDAKKAPPRLRAKTTTSPSPARDGKAAATGREE